MSKRPTRVERFQRWTQNQPVLAAVLILAAVIVGLAAVVASIGDLTSGWKRFRAPEDPRVFRYGDQTVQLTGGNSLTFEQAIILKGAFNTDVGIKAEYSWLKRFYLRYNVICQATARQGSRHYDVFVLRSPAEGERQLHFDVTEFFATPLSDSLESVEVPVEPREELFIPDPRTPREENANRCATIQGVEALVAIPLANGWPVSRLAPANR